MQPPIAQISGIPGPSTIFRSSVTFVGTLTSRILLYAIAIAGFYFLIRFIIAAFTSLTALGDPGKVQASQKTMLNALIGLLLVLSAYFLGQVIRFVFGILFL